MKFKNYILLSFIYVFTILIVLYLSRVYTNSIESISNYPDFVNDVTSSNYDDLYNNIYNYSKENPDFIVLVSSKKYLENFNLENYNNEILYVSVDELFSFKNLNRLINDFDYDYSVNRKDLPIFLIFENGNLVDINFEVIE